MVWRCSVCCVEPSAPQTDKPRPAPCYAVLRAPGTDPHRTRPPVDAGDHERRVALAGGVIDAALLGAREALRQHCRLQDGLHQARVAPGCTCWCVDAAARSSKTAGRQVGCHALASERCRCCGAGCMLLSGCLAHHTRLQLHAVRCRGCISAKGHTRPPLIAARMRPVQLLPALSTRPTCSHNEGGAAVHAGGVAGRPRAGGQNGHKCWAISCRSSCEQLLAAEAPRLRLAHGCVCGCGVVVWLSAIVSAATSSARYLVKDRVKGGGGGLPRTCDVVALLSGPECWPE
jgi:hypothetical protein